MVAVELERIYSGKAKERMVAGKKPDPVALAPQGKARDQAAAVMGVGARSVQSANLHRRHLDESQRSMIGGRATDVYEAAAKERQRKGGKEAGRGRPREKVRENLPEPIRCGRARDQAAAAVKVSGKSIGHAKVVLDKGSPELIAALAAPQSVLDQLPKDAVRKLDRCAANIRKIHGSHVAVILAYGRELNIAHGELSSHKNGVFGRWVAECCGISRVTAFNYMNVADAFGDKLLKPLTIFSAEALYFLARDSTPQDAIDEAVKAAMATALIAPSSIALSQSFKKPRTES